MANNVFRVGSLAIAVLLPVMFASHNAPLGAASDDRSARPAWPDTIVYEVTEVVENQVVTSTHRFHGESWDEWTDHVIDATGSEVGVLEVGTVKSFDGKHEYVTHNDGSSLTTVPAQEGENRVPTLLFGPAVTSVPDERRPAPDSAYELSKTEVSERLGLGSSELESVASERTLPCDMEDRYCNEGHHKSIIEAIYLPELQL